MSVEAPTNVAEALERSAACAAGGDIVAAVDLLAAFDRDVWDPSIERELIALRHAALPQALASAATAPWPEAGPYRGDRRDGMPVVALEDLDGVVVRRALMSHGCVLVPRVVDSARCRDMIEKIDRGFAAVDQPARDREPGWYEPFAPDEGAVPGAPGLDPVRLARDITMWSVDSPRLFAEVAVLLHDVGIAQVVEDYLGERPFVSAKKSNLRRVPVDQYGASWHQDGAFLGSGVRTLNVWLTLTDCGVDAPGMDVIPCRFEDVVETGAEGAVFDWAVSPTTVEEIAGDLVVRPSFAAGDVLLFDELFLHRTACSEEMTRPRYAIESWFFAPSCGYGNQVPLLF